MDKLKDRKVTVYGLITDLDDNIRYVGQTTKGVAHRLSQHIWKSQEPKNHKECWLNKRVRQGVDIRVVLLDEDAIWNESEIQWIKRLREGGCDLTNETLGGDGVLGRKHTEEMRRYLSNKHTFEDGRVMTIGEMAKLSNQKPETIKRRLYNGYSLEEAIIKRPKNLKILYYEGESYTFREVEAKFGIPYRYIRYRYKLGWDHNDIIENTHNHYGDTYLVGTGDMLTVKEIVKLTGIKEATIRARIKKGFSPDDIIRPLRCPSTVNVFGEQLTAEDISSRTGINVGTILSRMQRNVSAEELLKPVNKKEIT